MAPPLISIQYKLDGSLIASASINCTLQPKIAHGVEVIRVKFYYNDIMDIIYVHIYICISILQSNFDSVDMAEGVYVFSLKNRIVVCNVSKLGIREFFNSHK